MIIRGTNFFLSKGKHFSAYLKNNNVTNITDSELSDHELEAAFKNLKINKSPGYDDYSRRSLKSKNRDF